MLPLLKHLVDDTRHDTTSHNMLTEDYPAVSPCSYLSVLSTKRSNSKNHFCSFSYDLTGVRSQIFEAGALFIVPPHTLLTINSYKEYYPTSPLNATNTFICI